MEKNKIMTWMLTWLNVSTATLNATFQLLVIYRLLDSVFKILDYEIRFQDCNFFLSILILCLISYPIDHL